MSVLKGNQRNHWLKKAFLGLLMSFSVSVLGEGEPHGFRGGMEVELKPQILQRLVHYFDFSETFRNAAIQAAHGTSVPHKSWKEKLLTDYLDNPANYLALSDSDKNYLRTLYQRFHPEAANLIINPVPGIILPNGQVQENRLNNSDYQKARRAWRIHLPPEQQLNMIDASRVNPRVLAELWFALAGRFNIPRPDLRAEVPENGTSAMYRTLHRTVDFTDLSAVEFIHETPVTSYSELWNDIETFLRHAGTFHSFSSANVEDFIIARRNSSLHYHLSRSRPIPTAFTHRLNFLFLIQDIQSGYNGNFDTSVTYRYQIHLGARGLLRRFDGTDTSETTDFTRMEIRSHRGNLKAQFDYVTQLFAMRDEDAIRLLDTKIRTEFPFDALEKILSGVYPSDLPEPITDNEYLSSKMLRAPSAALAIVHFAYDMFPERRNEIAHRYNGFVEKMIFTEEAFRAQVDGPGNSPGSGNSCQSQFVSTRYNRIE